MTPEQRLDRAEQIIIMMAKAGRRARSEWRENVNMLINAQIATEDHIRETDNQIRSLAAGQTTLQKEMAELAKSLRYFIDRQERNGN